MLLLPRSRRISRRSGTGNDMPLNARSGFGCAPLGNTPRRSSPTPFIRTPVRTTASSILPSWSWRNAAGAGSRLERLFSSLIADCPSTSLRSFFDFDATVRLVLLYEVGRGRLRMGSEGRRCDLYRALPGEQACRTLCAVIRTSSPRDAVPRRGTIGSKPDPTPG